MCMEVSDRGYILKQIYDKMLVEKLFSQNTYIDWMTGLPLDKPDNNIYDPTCKDSFFTHCSSFVASVCYKLNVPILCPPDHGTEGLANLQYDWLIKKGSDCGWKEITSSVDAQNSANNGHLVVITYRNFNDDNKGHIAIVLPFKTFFILIKLFGVRICQAGTTNSSSMFATKGFSQKKIKSCKYFCHDIDINKLN